MAQSIKLGNDVYLDASGVAMNSSGRTLKDALGAVSSRSTTIDHNASKTIKMSAGASGLMLFISSYTDIRGAAVVYSEVSGNIRFTRLDSASGITLSTSANGLTITNNSANNAVMAVYVLLLYGEILSGM